MPAFPAGLRKTPVESDTMTTTGLFQKTSGTSSGTKLHATTTVRTPVGVRSMIRGAASAPSTPHTPAAVSTRPIDHGAKPAWMSRTVAAVNSALIIRLEHMPQTINVRKNGRLHWKRNPSATSSRARRRTPSASAGRRRGEVAADPAEHHPRDREGQRVEEEGHPPA